MTIGLALGVLAAFAFREVLSSLVFGIATDDPVTYALAILALSTVALAGVVVPALRAARIQPTDALRCE